MKRPTSYTRNNVSLERDNGNVWYLSVVNGDPVQYISVLESEIGDIADACIEMLIHWKKPPKGVMKGVAKGV